MKIEININDYISEDEKKEIAINAFKESIYQQLANGNTIEAILSNAAYLAVFKAINEVAEKSEEIIIEKTKKIINENNFSHYAFRYGWQDKQPISFASNLLEKTIKDNEELFKEKILETIKNLNLNETVLQNLQNAADNFTSNIYDLVEFAKQKKLST